MHYSYAQTILFYTIMSINMSLQDQVTQQLITAMKAKDTVALESLRAIKSALLLTQTQADAK